MSSPISLDQIAAQLRESQRRSTPLPPASREKLYVDRDQKIVRAPESGETRPDLAEIHQGIFAGGGLPAVGR